MDVEKLSVIFPVAAAFFILLWYWQYVPLLKSEPFPGRSFNNKPVRADLILMAVITVAYGVVAFIGLGDAGAPDSYCHFSDRGRFVVVELDGQTPVGGFRYYTGLCTGSYYVQFSDDGENFADVCTLEQGYADLFKWEENYPAGDFDRTPRYIRLIADTELYLNELVILDTAQQVISADRLVYDAGAAPLFDEQELLPETSSYMNSTYFDEIYHARTADENIEGIYPYEISHPPLGKLIISIGIRIFGMNPLGWRIMGTLFGALMLPCLYLFIKRMFGCSAIASAGTLIFAFDFMHYTQTRIATIDTYGVFFIILMYMFMYMFMDAPPQARLHGYRRRCLFLCGLCFGLGCASKWTCVYAGAGLGVLWLIYWFSLWRDTRKAKAMASEEDGEPPAQPPERFDFRGALLKNILWCLLFFVVVPVVIYYVSYYPYGRASGMNGIAMFFDKDYAGIVWSNQKYMLSYHAGVTATHPYSSRWYQWMVDARPILYYLEYFENGTKSAFGAFVNPILCWGGLLAMFSMAYLSVAERDRKALFILVAYLAQLVPWMLISRVTFEYHYFPCVVFLTLAMCHVFDRFRRYCLLWRRRMWTFTGVCVAVFALFYPVLSGAPVSDRFSGAVLQWLPSWPF